MSLKLQLLSIVFNFIYGVFYILLVFRFKKYLMLVDRAKKIISNFIFMCFAVFSYFFVLVIINSGILDLYYLLFLLGGFLVGYKLYNILCKV